MKADDAIIFGLNGSSAATLSLSPVYVDGVAYKWTKKDYWARYLLSCFNAFWRNKWLIITSFAIYSSDSQVLYAASRVQSSINVKGLQFLY